MKYFPSLNNTIDITYLSIVYCCRWAVRRPRDMAACGFLCQASPSWSTPCWPPASPRPLPRPPRPHSPGLRQLQARRRGRSTAATRCPRPRTETAGKVRSGARFRLLPHVGISKIFSVSLKYNLYPPQTIRCSRRRSARAA